MIRQNCTQGQRTEGVATNIQRKRGSEPCRLWGGPSCTSHLLVCQSATLQERFVQVCRRTKHNTYRHLDNHLIGPQSLCHRSFFLGGGGRMRCSYFWFHSEFKLLTCFDVFPNFVIFGSFECNISRFICGKQLHLHSFCVMSIFVSGWMLI